MVVEVQYQIKEELYHTIVVLTFVIKIISKTFSRIFKDKNIIVCSIDSQEEEDTLRIIQIDITKRSNPVEKETLMTRK